MINSSMIMKKQSSLLPAIFLLLVILGTIRCTKGPAPAPSEPVDPVYPNFPSIPYVFRNATEGYTCYRIPAIIQTSQGALLAFCEARKNSCDDNGNIDIVMKKSLDSGKTWSNLSVLVNNGNYKAASPAPVIDYLDSRFPGGRIFLLYNTITDYQISGGSTKRVTESWHITSSDGGQTWSQPVNITTQVHRPKAPEYNPEYNFSENWSSSINTPGHALQFTMGTYKGRIYVAANHAFASSVSDYSNYRSYGYYSDDHGGHWKIAADIDIAGGNESTAVELSDGNLLQNARYQNTAGIKRRILANSKTGGSTWEQSYVSNELTDPICQGSMLAVRYRGQYIVLFSNPASEIKREKMTIRASKNNGETWPYNYLVDADISSYSDLVDLGGERVGIIYERGNNGGIVFKNLQLSDVLKE
jgi:sialidase-1